MQTRAGDRDQELEDEHHARQGQEGTPAVEAAEEAPPEVACPEPDLQDQGEAKPATTTEQEEDTSSDSSATTT